jgi:hypothetical protein
MPDYSWRDARDNGDEIRRLAEESRLKLEAARKAAEAAPKKPKSKPQQPQSKATPTQVAQTAQPQSDPAGIVTQAGQWLQNQLSPVNAIDKAASDFAGLIDRLPDHQLTQPLKGAANAVSDFVPNQQELDSRINQGLDTLQQSTNPLVKSVSDFGEGLQSIDLGVRAGKMIPATIAARLAGQDATWSNPPAIIKDSPIGPTVFKIAEVLTPTLIGGGFAAAAGKGALSSSLTGVALESAAETVPQRNVDDLIVGRQLAGHIGEVATYLGYDGAALTRELIENKTSTSKAFVLTWGFLENLGINFTANKLFKWLGADQPLADGAESTARALGKDAKQVSEAIDNVNLPRYSERLEAHQAMDTDSQVRVSKPTPGNEVISDEALIAEALRKSGIGEDGLTAADRKYFTSWKAVAEESTLQKIFQESTKTLRALKSAPDDLKLVYSRAARWWDRNKALLDDEDIGAVTVNFANDMVKPLSEGAEAVRRLTPSMPVERVLKELSIVSDEGFIASQLVAEELGVRIQKAARIAMNLENATERIDFTDAIDTILDLHDKVNLFLVPLRRAKRKWYVEGVSQQRKSLKALKDSDIESFTKTKKKVSYDAPGDELTKIHKDDVDPGMTLRELWNAAQEGDEGALKTFKDYLNLVAYSEPDSVLKETTKITRVLRDQLLEGNKEASAQLFYAYMLSRVSTQVASTSSNIIRLALEPFGAALSGEKAYAKGQIIGGLAHLGEAFGVFRRALKDGVALNGGTKITDEVFNLKLRQLNLDERYKGALKELAEDGTDSNKLGLASSYTFQTWANNPLNSAAARLLMASDEATKALFASQVATGRAYQRAAQKGAWDQIETFVKEEFHKVFKEGVTSGKIIDAEVLEGAKHLTFQSDIPIDGNVVDNLFQAVKQGADTSAVMKFFTPFTRVSYNILETAGRYEPTGVLRTFVPRYKSILNGDLGDVAKLQLQSQIALGRFTAMSTVGLAWAGLVTGYNSGTLPKTSFIVPMPGSDTGYAAIPYNKLEPFASILAVTADAVQGLKDEVITQGQYDKYIQELIFSLGMASTDKTFQSGLTDMAAILDVKNFGEGSLTGISNASSALTLFSTGAVGGLTRMVSDWANPYMTIQAEQGSAWNTYWGKFRQRAFGGVGNPPLYDELTGKIIPKTTTVGPGDNYWAAVGASITNEFVFPGRVKGASPDDPLRKTLNDLNFKPDLITSIRTLDGVSLNLKQQSELSKVLHLELRPRLEGYFKSDRYKEYKAKFNRFRSDNAIGNTSEGTRSNVYLERIHADLRKIYRDSKIEAAQRSKALIEDPDFQQKRQAAQAQVPISTGDTSPQWAGIHAILGMTNR